MYYTPKGSTTNKRRLGRNTPHGVKAGYDIQPIRDPEKIDTMMRYLAKNPRNQFMFLLGMNSGLRVSDLLWLTVSDVKYGSHVVCRELKTGKKRYFLINDHLRPILDRYIEGMQDDDYLFPSNRWPFLPINRIHAYRILRQAGEAAGLDNVGTHSMRKTFGYHYYRRTRDVLTLMLIFNHQEQAVTLDYIGWTQDIIDESLQDFFIGGSEINI
ncbi:tyrosine-type recombinase/integrase [Brevibacillus reuszeri]|uniref:tyrosine-type recombinase/integrase n=1 Tax=Brevibacillus reuszeri TaxID=54915 RepID=UPI000CCC1B19|nr:tyrosine-type recombinase/integrase [Brevibacillus reuszeri]